MFVVALLVIAQNWKQPKCLSWGKKKMSFLGEWLKKLWYIHTVGSCSAVPRNEYDTGNDLGGSQRNYGELKKSIPKDYILYDASYVESLKWPNYKDGVQMSGSLNHRSPEKQNQ